MAPKKKSPEMAVTKRPDPILMSLCALVTVTVAMRITSIWHEAAAAASSENFCEVRRASSYVFSRAVRADAIPAFE